MALARERGWAPDEFEFEMLYGVRTDWQLALRAMGYNLRVYLRSAPTGGRMPSAGWGASRNAWLLARSLNSDGYAAGQG